MLKLLVIKAVLWFGHPTIRDFFNVLSQVEAAKKAGCDVIQVSGPWDVTTKLIESHMLMNGRGF
jgi:hypothetical protein